MASKEAGRIRITRVLPSSDAASAARVRKTLRLLLVDDHEDTNRSLVLLLRRRGYEVEAATSMAAAEEAVRAQPGFDILVADMGLPDGNGLDLLPRLTPRPRLGGIVLSGFGATEHAERSRAAGYRLHLCKPVDVARLDAVIREIDRQVGENGLPSVDPGAGSC